MSYIYSGGSEVLNNASGASTFGGYMSGYLVAADTLVADEPFTRIFRVYGKDADLHDVTVMSAGTMYFRSGAVTDLKVYSSATALVSATTANAYVTTLTSAVVSGGKAVATLRHLIADSVTVISGGSISIQSGGTITNLNFLAGNGTISGTANQRIDVQHMVVSGSPVSSGTGLSAYTTATVYLSNNVYVDDVTVNSGAMLRISSGATVTNLHAVGNTNKKTSPEQLMALVEVSGGALVSGGDAKNLTRLIVRAGGTAFDLDFHTSTHYYVHGLVSGGSVHTANFEVRGGTVSSVVVDSGGRLLFTRAASGQTFDVTLGSNGTATINSGGTMTRTLVNGANGGGAGIIVSSGAAISTTIGSSGAMTVSKLAWYTPAVTSTTLTDRGSLELYGVASDTVANNWGRMNVRSGGVASGVTLDDGGKTYLYANASADNITANANGYFYLYSGAAATNIVENGGFAWGQAGATLTFLDNAFSDIEIHSHATLHSVTTGTNIKVYGSDTTLVSAINFGGSMFNIEAFSGGVILVNSGHISGATVHSGGSLYIQTNNDKTFLSGAFVESGGSMTIKGGSVQDITVSGAMVGDDANKTLSEFANFYMYNGTLDGLTVTGIAGCYGTSAHADPTKRICAVVSGGSVTNVTIQDAGYVVVSNAGVSGVTMSKGITGAWCYIGGVSSSMNTRLQVYAGGVATNVKTLGGTCECFVQAGGAVYDISLAPGGYFGAYTNGLISGGSAVGKNATLNGRGGMISAVTLISSADMFVSTGTVRGINVLSGGYLRLGSKGANAVGDSTYASGGYGDIIISSGKEKYTSGCGNVYVSSGGKLTNSLIADGVYVLVRSNGIASNTALLGLNTYDANTQDPMMMGRIHVSGGGLWQGGDVLKHVQAIIYSGGSAEGITLASGAHFYISGNATATNLVADGTLDFVVRGGTAENTLIKKGSMTVTSSGTAGVASGTTLRGGVLRLLNAAAVASDTVVSNGGVISCNANGGTFENTTVSSGGYLYGVFGTYNGVTLSSGGSMRVYASGGTVVTGLTTEAGAGVYLDFIRAANGATNIDSLANVSTPVTILNWSPGNTYTLAEVGNANLEISINYQGFYTEFGTGETYLSPIYDGRAFTLDAEGKTLSIAGHSMSGTILTTEAADLATSGAFLTGFVNSDDKAIMWADVNLNGAVTFATSAANIAGDAWIDLDRTKAAGGTIYGAEGDCMSDRTIRYLVHGAGSVGNFAGGATAGGTVGGVELVGFNNTYGQTYLGGMGTVAGLVSARVSSGNTLAKDFYAGALANYAKTGEVTSVGGIDTTIALHTSAGTSKETKSYAKGNIYGASQVKAGTVTTAATAHSVGDVVLTVSNGESTKGTQMCIFAAGYATGSDAAKTLPVYTVGSVTATIAGGNWGEACGGRGVYGGAFAGDNLGTDGVWAKVGNVNLKVSGGTMGNVYGGGWAQKGAKSEVGNVNLTITGGTIANVFGGGSTSSSGGTTVAGNVTITVSGGSITGDIYARGQNATDSVASAAVIFTGTKNFDCGVYGYSYVPTQENDGVASGAALSFTSYAGTFSGAIGGFDGITFDGNTTMTLGTAAADVSNTAWTFDTAERYTALARSAFLEWGDSWIEADFTDDTIAINLAAGNVTEWDLVKTTPTTAYGTFDVLVNGSEIAAELELDQAIASGDYAGWGFTVEDSVLKFKNLA